MTNNLDYCIRYIDLPCTVNGMTVQDIDGFYNIYINSRLNFEQQNKAIQHEMCHIARGDFDSCECLEKIETM